MNIDTIRWWYACQNPGYRAAWDFILLNRQAGEQAVLAFDLRLTVQSAAQTSFDEAFEAYLTSAALEIESVELPDGTEVNIVRIDTAYVDKVLLAIDSEDFVDECAVYGFAGTPYGRS
jgi:hypothetical protein